MTRLPSLDASLVLPKPSPLRSVAATAFVAVCALAAMAAVLAILAWATGVGATPPPLPKNPFGVGLREGGAPGNAVAAWILGVQGAFDRQLTSTVRDYAQGLGAGWTLAGLGFAYGVFHAAGPGHGKAVISAWIIAQEKALRRGLGLSLAAAVLQAVVAVALVSVLALVLHATAMRMTRVAGLVEVASFAAVAAVGAFLLWRKAAGLAGRIGLGGMAAPDACGPDCGHVHAVGPQDGAGGWRSALGVVTAAGIRPCSGAILILVFALAQGVYWAGIGATFAMALGTAMTTGALAALAVFAKGAALRIAAGRGAAAERIIAGFEVLAAAFVVLLGLALLAGVGGLAGQG